MKIVKAESGTWLIGNYVKHCTQYHVLLPSEGRKKRTRYRQPGCAASKEEWLDLSLSTEDTSREDSREEVLSTLPDVKANDGIAAVGLIEETTEERSDPLRGKEIEVVGSIEETAGERANPLPGDKIEIVGLTEESTGGNANPFPDVCSISISKAESSNPLSDDEMNDEHTIDDDEQESPNCISDEAWEESLIVESGEESLHSWPAEADNIEHNLNGE